MAELPKRKAGPQFADEFVDIADDVFNQKAVSGELTVREAISRVAKNINQKTEQGRTNYNRTVNLIGILKEEGIDVDQPYFDIYESREFNNALDPIESKSLKNRWKEWGFFEKRLDGVLKGAKRNEPLTLLAGADGYARKTFELVGVQDRTKDPMRGLLFSAELDAIYDEALNVDSYEVTDKRGRTKLVPINQEARDYLIYEKYTGQRVETNIGKDGLKIADITFGEDAEGNLIANIPEKKTKTKLRPAVSYEGEFAYFLKAKVDQAKANLPEGADPSKADLFNTTKSATDKIWNERIKPLLEERHSAVLPASAQGNRKSIRKILARQLVQEFKFPKAVAKAWMGHAGAAVNDAGDVFDENYTGPIPDENIGGITNTLIRKDAKNGGFSTVNELFIVRRANIPDMMPQVLDGVEMAPKVAFTVPEVITGNPNVTNPPARKLRKSEKAAIDAAANKRTAADKFATEQIEAQREDFRIQRAQQAPIVDPEAIEKKVRAEDEIKRLREEAKRKIAIERGETVADEDTDVNKRVQNSLSEEPSDNLKSKLSKFGIRLGAGLVTTAATVAQSVTEAGAAALKVAGPVIPVLGFQQTKEELEELGISPAEAITQAAAEEANPTMGLVGGITRPVVGAFVEAAKEPFQEETGRILTTKNLERDAISKITGGQFNFASGGFIEKRE